MASTAIAVPLLSSQKLSKIVLAITTWSNSNRQSPLSVEILEWCGTYCIQDQNSQRYHGSSGGGMGWSSLCGWGGRVAEVWHSWHVFIYIVEL